MITMSDQPTSPDAQTPSKPAASGGRAGGRNNRNRGGRGNRDRSNRTSAPNKTGFKGNTDEMKGNVFECYSEHTDKQQFTRTLGVLGEYINKNITYPQDMASICKDFVLDQILRPANLTEDERKDDGLKFIWDSRMKTYMKRLDAIESNGRAIYAVIWGQCSPMMQSKLESLGSYEAKSTACDCVWILKEIQGITHRFEGTRNVFISLSDAWNSFYDFRQVSSQTLHDYHKEYQGILQVLDHYGASIGSDTVFQTAVTPAVKKSVLGTKTSAADV